MYFSKLLFVTCNINCPVLGAAVAYIDGKLEHLNLRTNWETIMNDIVLPTTLILHI